LIRTNRIIVVLVACVGAAVLCLPKGLQAHPSAAGGAPQKSAEGAGDSAAKAHVPATGSPERKEIMDGLRGDQKVVFKVHYLKVHGDWAFVDVTPLDDKGKPVAEGGASLMHKQNGAWKVVDLSVLPEDPDNPMGPDDPTPKFVKAVQKAFPGTPSDIFPPRPRSK
jgi:hypothetical protein